MKLRDPFAWLPIAIQKRAFVLLAAFTIVVMIALQILGGPLKTDAAPAGIVSYEFAGTMPSAQKMLDSWGATGRIYAGLNLGLDFLFIALYPLAIGLGCVLVARAGFLSTLGIVLAWGQFIAGMLDATENYALLRLLFGARDQVLPMLAQVCATAKFLFVGLGSAYVLLGAVLAKVRRA